MSKQLIIKKYSPLCTVVVGDTKPVKNFLMNNGGKYNPNLWIEEKKTPGYVFNNSYEEINKLVLKVNKDFDKFCNIERTYEKNENVIQEECKQEYKEKDSFIFTKEKYLSLITRIEKLENDNANLLKLLINKNNTNKNNINISSENDLSNEESDEEIDLNEDKKPRKRLF